MEWAIEVCKETGLPVAASMCIGPEGDLHGVSNEVCAVRMAKAGANVGEYSFKGLEIFKEFVESSILPKSQGKCFANFCPGI